LENQSYTTEGSETALPSGAGRLEPSEETDKQLLAATAQGDERAFTSFYERHSPAIFNYLQRLVHDQRQAEDLLQETFVAVWRGASAFKHQSKVKTWLFRIAHNKAVSWLRRHRPFSIDEEPGLLDDGPGPEMLAAINLRNEALRSALDDLTPNHRAVIELVFVHELAYSEIAQVMDCPIGTVKSRMSYALRHLNRLLGDAELG
jgi:RNA polymerase sigma-70 factor (ECF subfamily)